MYPKEDNGLENMSFAKAIGMTLFIIALGMTEKFVYEVEKAFKKYFPR